MLACDFLIQPLLTTVHPFHYVHIGFWILRIAIRPILNNYYNITTARTRLHPPEWNEADFWLSLLPLHVHKSNFTVSCPELFCKNGDLRNFAKFTRKHLCQGLFFIKVTGLRPATLLKKSVWHWCFPVNCTKFLRTPFFIDHLRWLLLSLYEFNFTSQWPHYLLLWMKVCLVLRRVGRIYCLIVQDLKFDWSRQITWKREPAGKHKYSLQCSAARLTNISAVIFSDLFGAGGLFPKTDQ